MAKLDRATSPRPRPPLTHSSFAASNTVLASAFISAVDGRPTRSTQDVARIYLRALHDHRATPRGLSGPSAPPLRAEPHAKLCRQRNSTLACRIATGEHRREPASTARASFNMSTAFREWICRVRPGRWPGLEWG